MFLIKLDNLVPLVRATALFTHIALEVDLKFSPLSFSIIARHPFPRFDAVLLMPQHIFTHYSVDHHHISTVPLLDFSNAIFETQNFSLLTIRIREHSNCVRLTFETPGRLPRISHDIRLSPAQDVFFGEISNAKFFSIDTEVFKRVIRALAIYDGQTICITITRLHVKFSVASVEIILRKVVGECIIYGDGEDATQLLITLHPTAFFIFLANQAQRAWFFKTTDSRDAIDFPFHADTQFVVYF